MTSVPSAPRRSPLLSVAQPFADGIAALFYPSAEVVVHDLTTRTVAYIANNLSRRQLGDDSALEDAEFEARDSVLGPYEKRGWDGGTLRCVSIVVRDGRGRPMGLVCVNFNTAPFEQARSVLDMLVAGANLVPQPEVLFQDDWQERINTFVHGWLREQQLALPTLTRLHKQALVEALYRHGAFNGRSAADYVARVLGLGRATVFKYIKPLKTAG